MSTNSVFKTQLLFIRGIAVAGVLLFCIGVVFPPDHIPLHGIGLAQLAAGTYSWWEFRKKNYVHYNNGILRWRFTAMGNERIINLKDYSSFEEKWFGFEFKKPSGEIEKISTDGVFKRDKKRFQQFLENEIKGNDPKT